MPNRFLRAVEPVVAHGLRELRQEGASAEHTLREVALMSLLVGAGMPPVQAIRWVEAMEPQLLGMPPGEAREPAHSGQGGMGGYGTWFPGMGPGMGFPGVGFPGTGFPGMGWPGKGWPGKGWPGKGAPGMGWFGMDDYGKDGYGKMMGPWGMGKGAAPMGWPQSQ